MRGTRLGAREEGVRKGPNSRMHATTRAKRAFLSAIALSANQYPRVCLSGGKWRATVKISGRVREEINQNVWDKSRTLWIRYIPRIQPPKQNAIRIYLQYTGATDKVNPIDKETCTILWIERDIAG